MELSERETLIIANQGDLKEGFFLLTTTEPSVLKKLVARVGNQYQINVLGESSWEVRLPSTLWSGLGVKSQRKHCDSPKRTITPEHLAKLQAGRAAKRKEV